ncbi:MAG: DUF1893 domain-containing protein [Clostridia bacterium]|nr:DUF1893 domain-containing protein [Clostridia bacterium]
MTDLSKAKDLLASGEYTCVLQRGEATYTSKERGVKPLFDWLESSVELRGFSAADRVVGKGAAFLYVMLGITCVYARVISAPAFLLLKKNGIAVTYDTLTEHIINRKGDGICPFEEAVLGLNDAESAYAAIGRKMKEINRT